MSPPFQIVDAHQHFWDLGKNYYPWLQDEPMIPFRYGDYSAIRKNYLPADYRKDADGYEIVGSVYVEAEWDRKDPVAEMKYIDALRRAERPAECRRGACASSTLRTRNPFSSSNRLFLSCAASVTSRAPIRRRRKARRAA